MAFIHTMQIKRMGADLHNRILRTLREHLRKKLLQFQCLRRRARALNKFLPDPRTQGTDNSDLMPFALQNLCNQISSSRLAVSPGDTD